MISRQNYRNCGIAINLLKILNKEEQAIAMFDTSAYDVGNLVKEICNVDLRFQVSPSNRDGQLILMGIKSHKKSEFETKKYLQSIVDKLGDSYWEQVKAYREAFGPLV